MAIEPERKVKPGDRMLIPAATYNSLIEMLRSYKRNKFHIGAGVPTSSVHPHHTVFVQNLTGLNLNESFKILRLSDVLLSIQDDPYTFSKRPVFGGYIPQSSNDPIAITEFPANGVVSEGSVSGSTVSEDIISCVVGGFTLALVRLISLTDEWANPTPGTVEYLISASTGQARIIYWENLNVSGLQESGMPSDIVLAVVNLIGSKAEALIPYKRDNNVDGCVNFDGTDPDTTDTDPTRGDYSIINDNTGPSYVGDINNRRTIWRENYYGGQPGPQLYIPANSGRVIIDGRIGVYAFSDYSFAGYNGADGQGLAFSFCYDIVSVDEFGHMIPTTLYDENGAIEFSQSVGLTNEMSNEGLIVPQPVLSGQFINHNGGERKYGDYNLTLQAFAKTANVRMCIYVAETPIRLAYRIFPRAAYTGIGFVGGSVGTDPVLRWGLTDRGYGGYQGSASYLDLFKVDKFGKCDIGQPGSVTSGGSVPAGSSSGAITASIVRSHPGPTSPDIGAAPQTVDFILSGISGGNGSYSFSWDFGDMSAGSFSQNPTHTYTIAGTYHPTVTISDTDGNTSGPLSVTNGNGSGDLIVS